MLEALEEHFPDGASWSRPEGGYFVWVDLDEDTEGLLERAEAAGVPFVKGSDFFAPGEGGTRSLRLAFSFASTTEIAAGIERLAGLLRGAAAPSPSL
jgi:DNA-binding transcriptional MocR family regulator